MLKTMLLCCLKNKSVMDTHRCKRITFGKYEMYCTTKNTPKKSIRTKNVVG